MMKPLHDFQLSLRAVALVGLGGWLAACGGDESTATSATAEAKPEQRIVSLGNSVTECVVALGAADRLIAVDASSTYPAQALANLPRVGYYRQIQAEGVLALRPTHVIASAHTGPAAVLEQIAAAGVVVVRVPEGHTPETVREKLRVVAEALEISEVPDELLQPLAALEATLGDRAGSDAPKVLFLMTPPGAGATMAAGEKTAAQAMIELAGGRNALQGFEGYKTVGAEVLLAAAPDVILYPTFDSHAGAATQPNLPGLENSPAVQRGRLHAVDVAMVLSFGPRLPEAVDVLRRLLAPAGGS